MTEYELNLEAEAYLGEEAKGARMLGLCLMAGVVVAVAICVVGLWYLL